MDTNIKENIEAGIEAITVDIPIRVTMTSINDAPFEFTTSIDELGQIILTPVSKDVEFVDVNTDTSTTFDIPVKEQETITTVNDEITTRETSILITANMLTENENQDISVIVDEIGQIVVSPVADKNVFVSAAFEDCLNLVTEELTTIDYYGYKLSNNGDGWDVRNPLGELIEEGAATEAEAKIVALETELHRLNSLLTEEVVADAPLNTEEDESETVDEADKDITPEVTAEVIEESAPVVSPEEQRQSLIDRFMRGDIPLFSDSGKPLETYIHLSELDSNNYAYYYDEESDSIVSYPVK